MALALTVFLDPMCGWCYYAKKIGMKGELAKFEQGSGIKVRRSYGVLAGKLGEKDVVIAPDETPITEKKRNYVRDQWVKINDRGVPMHLEFWNNPDFYRRRSTFEACQAVVAAGRQGEHFENAMMSAVQEALYGQGKNTYEPAVLSEIAASLVLPSGAALDRSRFEADFSSQGVIDDVVMSSQLTAELGEKLRRHFPGRTGRIGFPGFVLLDEANAKGYVQAKPGELIVLEGYGRSLNGLLMQALTEAK